MNGTSKSLHNYAGIIIVLTPKYLPFFTYKEKTNIHRTQLAVHVLKLPINP